MVKHYHLAKYSESLILDRFNFRNGSINKTSKKVAQRGQFRDVLVLLLYLMQKFNLSEISDSESLATTNVSSQNSLK